LPPATAVNLHLHGRDAGVRKNHGMRNLCRAKHYRTSRYQTGARHRARCSVAIRHRSESGNPV